MFQLEFYEGAGRLKHITQEEGSGDTSLTMQDSKM